MGQGAGDYILATFLIPDGFSMKGFYSLSWFQMKPQKCKMSLLRGLSHVKVPVKPTLWVPRNKINDQNRSPL